jgi:hypothetical protein
MLCLSDGDLVRLTEWTDSPDPSVAFYFWRLFAQAEDVGLVLAVPRVGLGRVLLASTGAVVSWTLSHQGSGTWQATQELRSPCPLLI